MGILAKLALSDCNVDSVFAVLRKLEPGFETFLDQASELDEPSVSQALHLHLMTILLRTVGSSFKGSDLMELAPSVPIAVDMLVAVFHCRSLPHALYVNALHTLLDLTRPDTFFTAAQCTDVKAIAELTKQYNANVNQLVKACLYRKLVPEVLAVLRPWMAHAATMKHRFKSGSAFLAPLQEAMSLFLHFINNLLQYSNQYTAQLRKHLAVETRLVPDLVLPFLQLCVEVLAMQQRAADSAGAGAGATGGGGGGGDDDDDDDGDSVDSTDSFGRRLSADAPAGSAPSGTGGRSYTAQSLCDALAVLVNATFRVKMFRQYLRADQTAQKVLRLPAMATDLTALALVIKLAINVDFLSPKKARAAPAKGARKPAGSRAPADSKEAEEVDEDAEELLADIKAAVKALSEAQRQALRRRLTTADAVRPVNM